MVSRIRSVLALSVPLWFSSPFAASAQTMISTWYPCPFGAECVAHRTLPKGTRLKLFNPKTGKYAFAVVRDRGPEAWTHRSLDVSRSIAEQLGMLRAGVASLEVTVLK